MTPQSLRATYAQGDNEGVSRPPRARNVEPVLDLIAPDTCDLLDIGCGGGNLLERAASRFKGLNRLVGIDRASDQADVAQAKLGALPIESEIHVADIERDFPPIGTFDSITMAPVLQWLYPVEPIVLCKISRSIRRKGVFVLSTSHQSRRENALDGSDDVVRGALRRLGWSADRTRMVLEHTIHGPIARMAKSRNDIKAVLSPFFDIDCVVERHEETLAENADQYVAYHRATFGGFYASRVGEASVPSFFDALGEEAMHRMADRGHVTSTPVQIWRCVNAIDKRFDVV